MSKLSGSDLATLRDALVRRQAELREEVRTAELARRAPGDPTEVGDRKDEAVRLQAGTVGEAEERRDVDELRQVEAALERLATGRYGECVACGAAIDPQRLRVQPAAERCAPCQAAHERREGRRA